MEESVGAGAANVAEGFGAAEVMVRIVAADFVPFVKMFAPAFLEDGIGFVIPENVRLHESNVCLEFGNVKHGGLGGLEGLDVLVCIRAVHPHLRDDERKLGCAQIVAHITDEQTRFVVYSAVYSALIMSFQPWNHMKPASSSGWPPSAGKSVPALVMVALTSTIISR